MLVFRSILIIAYMLAKSNTPKELEYLWHPRLILIYPEVYELEVAAELAIVDGGLVEGMILDLVNQDFKIELVISKSLVSFTPSTYTDVILEIYEQPKV